MDLATIWDFHFVWYRDDLVQPRVKLEQLNFGLRDPNFHTRHTCIKFKITIFVAFMNCVSSILVLQKMILHQLYILFQNIIWNTYFFHFSATRDSGISVNDVQKAAEQVQMRRASKGSMNGGLKNRNGSSKSVSR